jgi:hypothetical protein
MTKLRIGHNNGPSFKTGTGWRTYCWKRARKDLLGKTMPIEIVRIRIKRARELGLSYPQYASVMLGTGRDIVGFLFTVDGLQLKLRRKLEIPQNVQRKLHGITGTSLMSFTPSGEDPKSFRVELEGISGTAFVSTSPEPEPYANWKAARSAIRTALDPLKLPSDAVVMIGTGDIEKHWAAAGNVARFIPSAEYFNDTLNQHSTS